MAVLQRLPDVSVKGGAVSKEGCVKSTGWSVREVGAGKAGKSPRLGKEENREGNISFVSVGMRLLGEQGNSEGWWPVLWCGGAALRGPEKEDDSALSKTCSVRGKQTTDRLT